jgi:hypothetical protein
MGVTARLAEFVSKTPSSKIPDQARAAFRDLKKVKDVADAMQTVVLK